MYLFDICWALVVERFHAACGIADVHYGVKWD